MVISNISKEAAQLARFNTRLFEMKKYLDKAYKKVNDIQREASYNQSDIDMITTALRNTNLTYTMDVLVTELYDRVHPLDVNPATICNIAPMHNDGHPLRTMEQNALLIVRLHEDRRNDMFDARNRLVRLVTQLFGVVGPNVDNTMDSLSSIMADAIYEPPLNEREQTTLFDLDNADIAFKYSTAAFKTIYDPEKGKVIFYRPGLTGTPEIVEAW